MTWLARTSKHHRTGCSASLSADHITGAAAADHEIMHSLVHEASLREADIDVLHAALGRWKRFEHLSGEWRVCLACNRWGTRRAILRLFRTVSRLGDGLFWYALMAIIAVFGGAHGWQAALHMLLTGGVAAVLYRTLKHWTRRPRPFRAHAGIVAHIPPLDEFSFPSGHTLHAVTFSLVALAWFPVLAWLLVPFAALVAASRVILGLHYPSDVLVASVIGFVLAETSIALVF